MRHGETDANARGVVQGRTDSELNDRGREHAEAAGRFFADKPITKVITSPLKRARETAEIICRRAGFAGPASDANLMELNTGIFTDLTLAEAARRYPEVSARFRAESWDAVPEAETVDELASRAIAHWRRLIEEARAHAEGSAPTRRGDGNREATQAVPAAEGTTRPHGHAGCSFVSVSHGGLIQWLIKTVSGGEMRWMPLFPIQNCGISHLRVTPVNKHTTVEQSGGPPPDEHRDKKPAPRGYLAEWRSINYVPY